MTISYPILSRDAVHSRAFLDLLREQLHAWSLALYDPASGGFRRNEQVGPNLLSTTDIVWLRYAINDPQLGAPDREAIVRFLQGKQDPRTGKFPYESSEMALGHCDAHAFWQAVRALRILGAEPLHFPAHLEPVLTPAGLDAWFARFDWDGYTNEHPRHASHHEVLGIIPAIASLNDPALTEALFRNIAKQQNPQSGTWPRAATSISRTFAYTALHMAAGRLPNMPEKILDATLSLQRESGIWEAELPGFTSMDSAYLLVRLPPRIGGYRQAEATAALRRLGEAMRRIYAQEQATILNDTHRTLGVTHTFGLLQEAFPEEFPSERPYRFDWDKLELYACEIIARGRR